MFDAYLSRWNLVPDGAPITTHAARLLPVRQAGVPAMLKVAVEEDERQGGVLMTWWDGHGAARGRSVSAFHAVFEMTIFPPISRPTHFPVLLSCAGRP